MPSLILKETGKYQIKFYVDKKPKYLTLATGDKKQATTIMNMVERILTQKKTGEPDRLLTNWLANVPDDLRARLERAGLIKPVVQTYTLASVSTEFLNSKAATWKKITLKRRTHEHSWLVKYFPDKELDAITKKDAAEYLAWLRVEQKLAPISINKLLKHAMAVFNYAIDCEYTTRNNPFRGVRVPNVVQREKQYITTEYTETLIEAVPTQDWKTLIALFRYGGLRPEEALFAEWSGVDWEANTFTFRSPKTEHHPGKDRRTIPLFPRLLAALRALCGDDKPQSGYILTGALWAKKRKTVEDGGSTVFNELRRFVKEADLEVYLALPTNMRGSCSTDLKQAFPEHVVDTWLGHSKEIANRHYDVITPANLKMAIAVDCFDSAPKAATAHDCLNTITNEAA